MQPVPHFSTDTLRNFQPASPGIWLRIGKYTKGTVGTEVRVNDPEVHGKSPQIVYGGMVDVSVAMVFLEFVRQWQ